MTDLPLDVVVPEKISDLDKVLERVTKLTSLEATRSSSITTAEFSFIPAHIEGAVPCAKHEIQALLSKETYQEDDEDALDDGFFICDLNVVFQKLKAWRKLFPRIKPFYALKCNPDPMVAAILGSTRGIPPVDAKDDGNIETIHNNSSCLSAAGFDCASIPEIELALRYVSSRGAIYANPQRAEHDLDTALRKHQVRVLTFDGSEELRKIYRSHQQELEAAASAADNAETSEQTKPATPQLVLRILVPDEHSLVPLGEKFGAPPDRITGLVQLAMEMQLPIIGVSFHCGSGNHDPSSYVQAIRLAHSAMRMIDDLQQQQEHDPKPSKCWLLDMGGGYPGADGAGASLGRFSGKDYARIIESEQESSLSETVDRHKQQSDDNTGHHHEDETAANIAKAVTPLIDELFPVSKNQGQEQQQQQQPPVNVISEPGRYFVQEAYCLCSRIYRMQVEYDNGDNSSGNNNVSCADPKVIRRHYYIAQGVQGVFKDRVLCNETFTPMPLKMENDDVSHDDTETTMTFPSSVHGPSGNDYDVICPDLRLPELVVGDWLIFDCMGAYTLSIAARSGRPPVRYVVGGGMAAGSGGTGE